MNQIPGRLVADAAAATPKHEPRRPMRRAGDYHRLRLRRYALLIAADAVLMGAAFLIANLLRHGEALASYGVNSFVLLFPVYAAIGLNGGAWSIDALASPRRSAALAARSLAFAVATVTVLFFSLKVGEDFSRLVFGIGALLALAMVAAGRVALGQRIGRACGWTFRREIVIAEGPRPAPAGAQEVLDADGEGIHPAIDDPAMLDRLGRRLERYERVVVSCPPGRRQAWSRMLAGANVDVEILMPELDRLRALGLRRHDGGTTLLVGRGPLSFPQRTLKRLFDLALSAGALTLLLPLIALIALAIRIDSPGPALFRQTRMGRGNRLFAMLKFRTMRAEAADADGDRSASRDDARVTRVGRLLRRTSLDELPQLLNVLKGEMSLVGPRPHALGSTAGEALFWTIDERYWDRHAIKPGLTGLAQIRGLRGATATRADLTDRLRADLEYLDGWSLGRDIAILARTIGVMAHRNAY